MATQGAFVTSSAAAAFATMPDRLNGKPAMNGKKMTDVAQDFEASFLNSMFTHMFTDADGEGPLGGGPAVGVWRSFLTQEYSKSFAKQGGIGIADYVYRSLLAQQEANAR